MAPFRPLPPDKQYGAIGRLIAVWSMFAANIEEAIDCLERHKIEPVRASPDRRVMQRFDHFMRVSANTDAIEEYQRLKRARPGIIVAKRLRDALAHGNVVVWSEDFHLPAINTWNIEKGRKVHYSASLQDMDQHCRLLSQAAIDLHLASRRIAYGF